MWKGGPHRCRREERFVVFRSLRNWLRGGRSTRRAAPRGAAFQPTLEALEDRRLLSSSGLIASTYDAQGQPVVFAIRADQTLWEYDASFDTADHWMEVSPGAFESVSASPYATPDGPVVFAIVAGDHSLWENNPTFNPTATSLNDQWMQVSPGAFDSISATVATVNGQLTPVVYGIVSGDHSLWENNPVFNPGATSLNDQWLQVSPGSFTAIAAAFHQEPTVGVGQPAQPYLPVVFGIVAGDHSIWENDPTFDQASSDPRAYWAQVTTAAYTTISARDLTTDEQAFVLQGQLPVVYGVRQADQSLWEAGSTGELEISANPWQDVGAPDPTAISAVDGSLWFAGHNNGGSFAVQISPGSFRAVAPDFGIVFAEPTDHSLWEYNPALFNPQSTDPNDHWGLLSLAGVVS